MPRPAADSVRVQWTGTGTGTMSLGPAVAGFQAFPASLDGLPISYSIETEDGLQRENGIGTYTASGTTLTRDIITFSTAGAPTKQTFAAGTKHVRLSGLAHDVVENRAAVDPTAGDDITQGYIAGRSRWINTVTQNIFVCSSHAAGVATWVRIANPALFKAAPTTVKTSSYTAVVGESVRTNTSAGIVPIALPAPASDGVVAGFEDTARAWNDTNYVHLHTTDGSTIAGNDGSLASGGLLLDGGNSAVFRRSGGDWKFIGQTGLSAEIVDGGVIVSGPPIPVNGARTYLVSDNGKTFVVGTAATQTIPAGLGTGWAAYIWNMTSSGLQFTIAGPGTSTTLALGQVAFIKYISTTAIRVIKLASMGIDAASGALWDDGTGFDDDTGWVD